MKTRTLAKTVLSMFNDGNKELTIIIKEEDDLELYFGISVVSLFDGKYLTLGIYGGGFIRTVDWEDNYNFDSDDDIMVDTVEEFLGRCLNDWYGSRSYEIIRCLQE